jgi:hypothetical protein
MENAIVSETNGSVAQTLCKIGGIAAILFLIYSMITMVILTVFGVQPATALECFTMLQTSRMIGLLRMDLLTAICMPLYFLIFLGIFIALKGNNRAYLVIALICVFVGVTLFMATPSVLSMMALSDKYARATTEVEKSQLIAAGEAILSADMFHGTGAMIGRFLVQVGALLFSIEMLGGKAFNKSAGYIGIAAHGLDLVHLIFMLIIPTAGDILMAIAGTLYLLWFPMVGVRLIQIGKNVPGSN